jgi:hypothetical protein
VGFAATAGVTVRLLTTVFTPGMEATALEASVRSASVGTSPARVTMPLLAAMFICLLEMAGSPRSFACASTAICWSEGVDWGFEAEPFEEEGLLHPVARASARGIVIKSLLRVMASPKS